MSTVKIALDDLTVNNLGLFNVIAAPKTFSDSYIQEAKESGELAQYAYYSEVPVGLIVAKPLQPIKSKSPVGLLIDTLCVLKSYSHEYNVESEAISYIEELALEKRHLNKCYIVINKVVDEWLFEIIPAKGYIEEDLNDELYKGLDLAGGNENIVLFKKDLVKKKENDAHLLTDTVTII